MFPITFLEIFLILYYHKTNESLKKLKNCRRYYIISDILLEWHYRQNLHFNIFTMCDYQYLNSSQEVAENVPDIFTNLSIWFLAFYFMRTSPFIAYPIFEILSTPAPFPVASNFHPNCSSGWMASHTMPQNYMDLHMSNLSTRRTLLCDLCRYI